MSNPTPGPWAINPVVAQVDAFDSGKPVPVCQLLWPTELRSEAVTEANAALIAAAPELLEALKHAVSIIEAHVDRNALGMNGDARDGKWPLLDEYLHHMKAAIAKASLEGGL